MELHEDENFIIECNNIKVNNYINKKPRNSLDFMKLNSDEYLKYKFESKVKEQLKNLKLEERIIKEITETSFYYLNKIKEDKKVNLKKSDLISIITFKFVKYYNLNIFQYNLIEKINLDKSKYLKYSKMFEILNIGNQVKNDDKEEFDKELFYQKIMQYLNHVIKTLKEVYKLNPGIIKTISKEEQTVNYLENLYEKVNFSNNLKINCNNVFNDHLNLLGEIIKDASKLIYYSESNELNFFSYFNNKLLVEAIAAGMVKYFLPLKGLCVNLSVFKDHFSISSSSISRSTKMIKEYIKMINYK